MNILNSQNKESNVFGAGVSTCQIVSNCTIHGNAIANATAQTGRVGAGAYDSTLRDCVVFENFSVNTAGGGMFKGVAYDCVFSNNCCIYDAKMGASFRDAAAEGCTFFGDGIDRSCRLVNCKILNCALSCTLPEGANVWTNGTFSTSGHVLSTIWDGNVTKMGVTNCLFVGCKSGSYLIDKASADTLDVVNCTFVDNYVNMTVRDRKGSEGTTSVPLNMINCAFSRNYNSNYASPSRQDFKIEKGENRNIVMKNCLFGPSKVVAGVTLVTPEEDCVNNVTDMMFDTSNAKDPYSLKRNSPAIGAGLYMDWMASAKDIKGDPRAHESSVAIGCYECWLVPPGFLLLVR